MAAQSRILRKLKTRRKSATKRSLVKCSKCCHTARNHFKLRRHLAIYHSESDTRKPVECVEHILYSRISGKRRLDGTNIRVSRRGGKKVNPFHFSVGRLVVKDENLENPAVKTVLASRKSVRSALGAVSNEQEEETTRRPRKVYTRVPRAQPVVTSSSSGRTLRSTKKYAECCAKKPKSKADLKFTKNSSKVKMETLQSRSSSESKTETSKSKNESLKLKRGPKKKKKREKRGLIPVPCHLCDYVGRDSYNLRRHMQSKHEPKPPKVKKIYHCEFCEYKNVYRFLVKRHSAIHFREGVRKGEKASGFACDKCNYVSASACNLKRHQACRHEKLKEAKLQCSLCDHREPDRPALFGHFREAHGVIIETERLEFDDFQSFMDFKTDTEKATFARFVRQQTRTGEKKHVIFKCHRDGIFKSKSRGERKRALKTTGSNKINSACPASMRMTIDPSGRVSVVFTKTHVGHSNEVCRLTLTKEERILIAEMLESKRTFQEILSEIRNGMDSERLERIHLLSRKDLQNIERWYKTRYVEEPPRTSIDINVDAWVTQVQETGVVRLYKKPATTLPKPYKCLEYGDFVLILANDFQLAMLRQYGNDCICIDNAYENSQVKLTSLLVLDDNRRGFPCAFLLSSKIDKIIMKVFLEVVKKESGCPMTPSILISDIPDYRRTEWSAVIDLPQTAVVLYSPWSIDDDLKRNLHKVKNETEREEVYNVVKHLIFEKTAEDIQHSLAKTINFLDENPSTEYFGKYFKSKFADTAHKWASRCRYRLHADSSNNLESVHSILKFVYAEGKKNEKLEDCVNVLMSCVRDQLHDRTFSLSVISSEKSPGSGDEIQKLTEAIAKRHEDAVNMKNQPADSGVYEIMENNLQCRCGLRCVKCDVCIHSFRCSCNDSVLGWTICKHIHFCIMNNSTETRVTLTASHFDPLEEKQKLLLEFENMCEDIAAHEEGVGETTVVEVPVIEEYSHDSSELKQVLEHHEQEEQLLLSTPVQQQQQQDQQQQLEDEELEQLGDEEPKVDDREQSLQQLEDEEMQERQQLLEIEEKKLQELRNGEQKLLQLEHQEQQQQQEEDEVPEQHSQNSLPHELVDARNKLQWRFLNICQQMSSDGDFKLIEQALASIETAIALRQTSR